MASGSKQTQTVNQTTTQTPSVPSYFQNPTMALAGNVERMAGMDPSSFVTPATANQNTAFQQAPGLLNFQPQNVSAGTVNPGQLSSTDLSRYMNPYTQSVVDTSLNDLDRARRIAINGNSGAFTMGSGSNAWLSDRAGVADAETNRGFLDQAASLSAGLRQSGYNTALGAAQFDIGNRFNADQFNVSNRFAADQFNAAQGLAANQNQRANLGFLADLGATERSIASENNPNVAALSQSQALAQLLASLNQELYTGQTSNTNGTTTAKSNPGFLESLGTLAMGAGALGYNPFRVGK